MGWSPVVGGWWTAWNKCWGAKFITIIPNPATRENGCLQVLRGSHHLGRVDHGKVGDQTGADPERVAEAVKRLELVYCVTQPGAGVFFHCNLLHRSDQNTCPHPRWSYICGYNAARNNPYKESKHPCYHPLAKVPDESLKDWGNRQLAPS